MATACFNEPYSLITTSCQLASLFLSFWREHQGFGVSPQGPLNNQEAVTFQRAEAMTEIAFVPLPRAH
jgi:hypothetical protein